MTVTLYHCKTLLRSFRFITGSQSTLTKGETYKRTFLNPKLVPNLEITNFTIANPTNVLIECGFACNKPGADCDALYVQGSECHLLKVGHIYLQKSCRKI